MKGKQYKDVFAVSGSQLYEAISEGNIKKAEEIYQTCKKESDKIWPEDKRYLINWKVGEHLNEQQSFCNI